MPQDEQKQFAFLGGPIFVPIVYISPGFIGKHMERINGFLTSQDVWGKLLKVLQPLSVASER